MECQKCGECCRTFPIDVTYNDIMRWEASDRKDILREVSFINNYPEKGYGGFYIEKTLRNPKQSCPFLREDNTCHIYGTHPLVCEDFPFSHDKKCCCPAYNPEEFSPNARSEINERQEKDFKKANENFNQMMAILVKARH